MRQIVRGVRILRPIFRYRRQNFYDGSSKRRNFWFNANNHSVYTLSRNLDVCGCRHSSYMISRSISADAARVANGELNREGPLMEYERRIAAGELSDGDSCQLGTLGKIQRLYDELVANAEAHRLNRYETSEEKGRSKWLWARFIPKTSHATVRGLYLYGGVGTGKTMLMDLFFDQLPCSWRKKRIHFHDFMLNVHSRLQKHKGVADPLEVVAGELSEESILLCLDEFMVTDVADALILNRLFRHLFNNGAILVATSNRAPDKLYEGGLQRDLFLPFIATLKERCVVHEIGSSVDYRKMTSVHSSHLSGFIYCSISCQFYSFLCKNDVCVQLYLIFMPITSIFQAGQGFYLVGRHLYSLINRKFQQLIGEHKAVTQEVEVVMGRKLQVPKGANGCAYFPFHELCDRPLGAADYFGLFNNFHTLALEGVPIFGPSNKTAAHRFVTLVDVMYENRARLLCSAEGTPIELFERIVTISDAQKMSVSEVCVDNELGFAKDRTISRLTEMNSREYLEQHAQMLAQKQEAFA